MRRILCDPNILGGKPVIEGTRISVEQVLGFIAKGMSIEDITSAYPILAVEDVRHAVDYARLALQNDVVLDVRSA